MTHATFTQGRQGANLSKKLTSVFLCVCPVIDHEFRRNIVKVAVDPRGVSRVDLQTTLTMLWRNSLPITGQTYYKLTTISHSCHIHVSVRILTIKISQWARVNFCSYRKNGLFRPAYTLRTRFSRSYLIIHDLQGKWFYKSHVKASLQRVLENCPREFKVTLFLICDNNAKSCSDGGSAQFWRTCDLHFLFCITLLPRRWQKWLGRSIAVPPVCLKSMVTFCWMIISTFDQLFFVIQKNFWLAGVVQGTFSSWVQAININFFQTKVRFFIILFFSSFSVSDGNTFAPSRCIFPETEAQSTKVVFSVVD